MNINGFWRDVIAQNREALPAYFCGDAVIRWHNTNEQFGVEEYIKANCDYPGEWTGEIERTETAGSVVILVGRVFDKSAGASFHVVSFITLKNGKIGELDEYWSDDGDAPEWRLEMNIGKKIRSET